MKSRLALLLSLLVTTCASALAGEAGRLVLVAGQAQVADHAAKLEMAVQEGDVLSTGANGYIYMKTVDDGLLILRPNSKARVTTYHVDQVDPSKTQVKLELMNGVARSISGKAVKAARQNFRFNTPVAAIGVRGTDFTAYANQVSTWVSVASGGIVMSAFGGACGPEGTGPCEGRASRELFAGRPDVMLQVERGQDVPRELHNPTVAPELQVPARPDEPTAKVASTTAAAAPSRGGIGDVSLDASKSATPVVLTNPAPPAPVVTTPPVVVNQPDPVVVQQPKGPPELLWGRWQAVADHPADSAMIAKIAAEANVNRYVYDSYVVARPNNSPLVLPTEGKASFTLTESAASITKAGGTPVDAAVQNAHLDVDFVARSFSTSLSVVNALGQVDISAKGDITANGGLASSLLGNTATVRGFLGGSKADEAAYIFKSTGAGDLTASGVTRWSR